MQYGLALLREVEEREENADVLGDMMPKEIATGVAEKSEAAGEASKDNAQGDEQGEDGSGEGEGDGEEGEEEEEGGADGEEQPETDKGGGSADASGKAPAEGGAGEAGGEEEADDLQIAYEVLESARIIMEKEDDQSEKLGDVFGYLGDVNLRNEQFDQALADYTSCLKIREATCLNDDRLLIEVYHQMAMVYLLVGGQKDNAVSVLRKAIEHCEYRLRNLRMMIEGEGEIVKAPKGSSLKAMTKAEADAEMIEVEQIAEEFRERIEAEELKPDAGPEGAGSSSGAGGSSSAGAAASSLGLDAVKLLAAQSGQCSPFLTDACNPWMRVLLLGRVEGSGRFLVREIYLFCQLMQASRAHPPRMEAKVLPMKGLRACPNLQL